MMQPAPAGWRTDAAFVQVVRSLRELTAPGPADPPDGVADLGDAAADDRTTDGRTTDDGSTDDGSTDDGSTDGP